MSTISVICFSCLSIGATFISTRFNASLPVDAASLVDTVAQVWLFIIGAVMRKYTVARLPTAVSGSLLLVGNLLLVPRFLFSVPDTVTFFLTHGAAVMVTALIAGGVARSLFDGKVAQYLGRFSYPLYAIHFPVLYASLLGLPTMPWIIAIASSVALILATAISANLEWRAVAGDG